MTLSSSGYYRFPPVKCKPENVDNVATSCLKTFSLYNKRNQDCRIRYDLITQASFCEYINIFLNWKFIVDFFSDLCKRMFVIILWRTYQITFTNKICNFNLIFIINNKHYFYFRWSKILVLLFMNFILTYPKFWKIIRFHKIQIYI